jgi:hypothetical protein
MLFGCIVLGKGEGEKLKAPRYASAAALCDDHVTIYNIIPNSKATLLIYSQIA